MRAERKARRIGLIAAAALSCGVSAAAPAGASAMTVGVDHECYRPGQNAQITGEGYTPGGEVALTFNMVGAAGGMGSSVLFTHADGAGKIDMGARGPQLPRHESPADVYLL